MVSFLFTARAEAYRFGFLGSRSLGMGGVGTGLISDSTAIYWNPALTPKGVWEFVLPWSFDYSERENFIDFVDEIADFELLREAYWWDEDAVAGVESIFLEYDRENSGIQSIVSNGIFTTPKYFSFGVYVMSRVAAFPAIDTMNLNVDDPFSPEYILNNTTAVEAVGLEARVYAFSYSVSWNDLKKGNLVSRTPMQAGARDYIPSVMAQGGIDQENYYFIEEEERTGETGSDFYIGFNINIMDANTYFVRHTSWDGVFRPQEKDNIVDTFLNDNKRSETEWTVDLGLYYQSASRWGVGLVAKSLNSPNFSYGTPDQKYGTFDLDPEVRLGFNYQYRPDWIFAADLDLTANETGIPDFKERMLAFGTEKSFTDGAYLLRGGFQVNTAKKIAPALTVGGGFVFSNYVLDLGVGTDTAFDQLLLSATFKARWQ
jgi:hypothetical protein